MNKEFKEERMALAQQIQQDMKEAMRSKDQAALRALRAIKSAILLAQTDGSNNELDADAEIKLLQKLVKQRRDSISVYQEQGREDLAADEIEEVAVIEKYLPEAMSEEELEKLATSIIEKLGASSKADMGKVMGLLGKEVSGRADGKTMAAIVGRLLS